MSSTVYNDQSIRERKLISHWFIFAMVIFLTYAVLHRHSKPYVEQPKMQRFKRYWFSIYCSVEPTNHGLAGNSQQTVFVEIAYRSRRFFFFFFCAYLRVHRAPLKAHDRKYTLWHQDDNIIAKLRSKKFFPPTSKRPAGFRLSIE